MRFLSWSLLIVYCLLYAGCRKNSTAGKKEIRITADTDSLHHVYTNNLSFDISERGAYMLNGVNYSGHFYCLEFSGYDNQGSPFSKTIIPYLPDQTIGL